MTCMPRHISTIFGGGWGEVGQVKIRSKPSKPYGWIPSSAFVKSLVSSCFNCAPVNLLEPLQIRDLSLLSTLACREFPSVGGPTLMQEKSFSELK